jgi:hypothetical protein
MPLTASERYIVLDMTGPINRGYAVLAHEAPSSVNVVMPEMN